MTDRAALLAAVYANPADDAPRLVFADWLDEHGEPERAEFIRVQVEMRRECERNTHVSERHERLFLRSREVFYQPWSAAVRAVFGAGVGAYSRGFPARTAFGVNTEVLVEHLAAVETWLAPETEFRLFLTPVPLKSLAAVPALRHVRHIAVYAGRRDAPTINETDVTDLLRSPHLTGLRSLALVGLGLTEATAVAIQNAPALRSLTSLNLGGNQIGRAGSYALANAPHLASLEHLNLQGNRLGTIGVRTLLRSPTLAGLKTFNVTGNRISYAVELLLGERFPGRANDGDEIPV